VHVPPAKLPRMGLVKIAPQRLGRFATVLVATMDRRRRSVRGSQSHQCGNPE